MIDKWIEQLKGGSCISEADLKRLCTHVSLSDNLSSINTKLHALSSSLIFVFESQVKNLLMEEANVQPVRSPVTVRDLAPSS